MNRPKQTQMHKIKFFLETTKDFAHVRIGRWFIQTKVLGLRQLK